MLWIASVTAFSSVGALFLLWCLLNFIREGRRYPNQQRKMKSTDRTEIRNASVVPIRELGLPRGKRHKTKFALLALLAIMSAAPAGRAQEVSTAASDKKEIEELRQMVHELRERVTTLEARQESPAPAHTQPDAALNSSPKSMQPALPEGVTAPSPGALDFLRGTTINFALDGYYGYNFNRPAGRLNLLRAYDVSSNSFSLNQANVIIERAPDVAAGHRLGARLDLQYGQATEATQGSAANELRPQVYRPIFQAYGTYVAPVGNGLTLDFGKFASAMGIENNYSKDQINYSRSYFFDFLPFYHMGVRATYKFADWFTATYAVVNGMQQSEDFNANKSQMLVLTVTPRKNLSWNINYCEGREQRDSIVPRPDGRLHIMDSYVTWTATSKLTLALEGDYVINRVFSESAPAHVGGGATYARYQFTPKTALAARAEYLSDRGGLFSGATQALKETTLTYEYKFADGFLMRTEWRRDFSNQPFFLTEAAGVLKKEQNTATVGMVWWFGQKQGPW